MEEEIILQLVHDIRSKLPRLGTAKLLFMIAPTLASHNIKVGRDYFFDLLRDHRLLIRQRKRKVYTTNSRHWMKKYANLSNKIIINRPDQLWVSDMTFIRLTNQWGYLSLITDAYSRKIVGYCFRVDMLAVGCVQALKMALLNRKDPAAPLMHHSDRGSQYCSKDYTDLLLAHNLSISMTQCGSPYENALAERINGIIKGEFNLYQSSTGFENTYNKISQSIQLYNEFRPHSSCGNLTPEQAHCKTGPLNNKWKTYRFAKNKQDSFEQSGGATIAPNRSVHYGGITQSQGLNYECKLLLGLKTNDV